MKKILRLIILFLFVITNRVKAETYYGDYFRVNELDTNIADETKIETYKLYNTYKKEYIDMGYLEENNEYIKDENDFIYKEILTETYKDSDINININTTMKSIRYLYIGELSENLKIFEIELFLNGKKVSYEIVNIDNYINYNKLDILNIYDENYETFYINNDKYNSFMICFNVNQEINLNDLTMIIHTKEDTSGSFIMYLENYKKIALNNNIDRKHIISFKTIGNFDKDIEYFYKENIKLYKYYKENMITLNNYVKDGDNILLDDYIIVEEYYKRHKLVLEDNIIIDKEDKDLIDFIKYSTDKVITNCNIDYNKNGIYNCSFKLNDINITKEVTLNIKKESEELVKEEITDEKTNETNDITKEETFDIVIEKSDDATKNENNIESIIVEKKEEKNISDNTIQNKSIIKKEKTKNNQKTTKVIKLESEKEIEENIEFTKNINNKKDKTKLKKILVIIILIIIMLYNIILIIKNKK